MMSYDDLRMVNPIAEANMNDEMTTNQSSTSSKSLEPVFGFDPYLIRYGAIFLLIVGTFGNILSFVIFSYGTLRKSSTFRYLALLSLTDLLVLYSGLLDLFLTIEYNGAFSLRNLNPITCRLHTFITYWSQHSSSWILSFISVDRAIATNCIQFARKFCTPRSAEYIVACILLTTALLNCHELIYLQLQNLDVSSASTNSDEYTTVSPVRINSIADASSSSSPSLSVVSNENVETNYNNHINRQKRNLESGYFVISVCDNPQWNFLCPREKRDLSLSSSVSISNRFFYSSLATSIPNVTTNIFTPDSLASSVTVRQCLPLKGGRYDFFWDHVWEWIDVCLYAVIPFTVMSIGTYLIVYRVYYQQRRLFRTRGSAQTSQTSGTTPNKAKSLFYLLFTLNLLYFILVSPVVLVTTIFFRNDEDENKYPRFKAIIYLMQYCNHSLNFIFYGITSPPYRRTLWEWFELLIPHLPQCCQRTIRRRSKTLQTTRAIHLQSSAPQQIRVSIKNENEIVTTTLQNHNVKNERVSLLQR